MNTLYLIKPKLLNIDLLHAWIAMHILQHRKNMRRSGRYSTSQLLYRPNTVIGRGPFASKIPMTFVQWIWIHLKCFLPIVKKWQDYCFYARYMLCRKYCSIVREIYSKICFISRNDFKTPFTTSIVHSYFSISLGAVSWQVGSSAIRKSSSPRLSAAAPIIPPPPMMTTGSVPPPTPPPPSWISCANRFLRCRSCIHSSREHCIKNCQLILFKCREYCRWRDSLKRTQWVSEWVSELVSQSLGDRVT